MFELPVVWWMFLISQIFGGINIIIAFIKFQYKEKAKTLKLSAVGNVFKSLNYAFLLNWSLAGLKVVSIFKNLFFVKTSKGEVGHLKSVVGFLLFCLVSALVVFWAWWFSRNMFEWVLLAVVLFANYGKWAKGIHIMRISQVVYRIAMIINSILFFLNFTNIIKAVAVIISIIIFYTRYFIEKKEKQQENVEQINEPA
ncbi:MAG: YgjV family protein [Erysipelotrichales bacterium]|nr:YgjV family protein [Erysipelotrichales bacterium]